MDTSDTLVLQSASPPWVEPFRGAVVRAIVEADTALQLSPHSSPERTAIFAHMRDAIINLGKAIEIAERAPK